MCFIRFRTSCGGGMAMNKGRGYHAWEEKLKKKKSCRIYRGAQRMYTYFTSAYLCLFFFFLMQIELWHPCAERRTQRGESGGTWGDVYPAFTLIFFTLKRVYVVFWASLQMFRGGFWCCLGFCTPLQVLYPLPLGLVSD